MYQTLGNNNDILTSPLQTHNSKPTRPHTIICQQHYSNDYEELQNKHVKWNAKPKSTQIRNATHTNMRNSIWHTKQMCPNLSKPLHPGAMDATRQRLYHRHAVTLNGWLLCNIVGFGKGFCAFLCSLSAASFFGRSTRASCRFNIFARTYWCFIVWGLICCTHLRGFRSISTR